MLVRSLINNKFSTLLLIATISTVIYFLQIWNYGFNTADEGFLWYGAWRILEGEIPFVDFQSYDPFRYYWVAFWFKLIGNHDLLSLRIATYSFGTIGLFVFLYLLNQKKQKYLESLVAILLFLTWLFPHWKIFEHTISITSIGILYLLLKYIDQSNNKVLIYAGIYTSFLLFVGRNHALYMHFSIMVFFILEYSYSRNIRLSLFKLRKFLVGYMLGAIPIVYMLLFTDGYLERNIEWIKYTLEVGTTNLSKSFLFPWDIQFQQTKNIAQHLFFSIFTLLMIASLGASTFFIITTIYLRKKIDPLLLASAILIIPYFHYFASRPDISHLAQTIFPMIILIFTLLGYVKLPFIKNTLLISFFISSVIISRNPVFSLSLFPRPLVKKEINNHIIYLGNREKQEIDFISNHIKSNGEGTILLLPNLISFYTLFSKQSPIYTLYAVLGESEEAQTKMIHALEKSSTDLIIIKNQWFSKKLVFTKSYSLLYKYILDNYEKIDTYRNISVFKRIRILQ